MNNYIIDASVYAFPFSGITQNPENRRNLLIEFAERIQELSKIVIEKQIRHLKYFLSYRDIEFLRISKLDLTQMDMNSTVISAFDKDEKLLIYESQILLEGIFKRLKRSSEYIEFEEWFKILNINFNSAPLLNGNVIADYHNYGVEKNTINNIAIIAALNNYVYKNTEIMKIIYYGAIFKNSIQITADFVINMSWKIESYGNGTFTYIYKIRNFPQNNNIKIRNQIVHFSPLDVLINDNYRYFWKDNLAVWNKKFKHIEFSPECIFSLEQYKNKIKANQKEILIKYKNKVKAKNNTEKERDALRKIKLWKKQVMDVIYENLTAIDNFLDVNKPTGNIGKYECYDVCKPSCDKFFICGAHIRYFGVDCVDESKKHKSNQYVELERTINNEKFWLHIRPDCINCKDKFWYFSLRIHFRWITSTTIKIGWIGRHLYLPCQNRDSKTGEIVKCNRPECSIYKNCKNDPALEYQYFLKEW